MKQKVVAVIAYVAVAAACGSQQSAAPAQPPTPEASVTSSQVSGVVPANAIVTLLPATGAPPVPTEPVVIDQISKQFIPGAVIARVGQPVEFHNGDDLPHNVTVTRRISGAEVFNVSTEIKQKYAHAFDRVGQYDVKCDIHEGMEAVVIVARGPVTVIAQDDGRFEFPNVAFGSYKLSVTFAGQTVERPLEVKGARTEANITP